jgi:phage tail sheath gpL-like
VDDNTPTHCTWLAMAYMDATGTVRIMEIPAGNQISVMVEDIYAATDCEVDLVSIPIKDLPTMFNQGVKVTIEAHNSSRSDGVLLRAYGRG